MQRNVFLFILLAAVGWLVLAYFTHEVAPTTLTAIVFLILLFPTAMVTLTPMFYAGQRRFLRAEARAQWSAALREGALSAGLLVIWGGLHLMEALNWVAMAIMVGVVALLEVRLLLRR